MKVTAGFWLQARQLGFGNLSVCLSVCRCNLSYQCNELFYSTLFSLIYPSLDSLTVTVDYVGGEFLLSWSPASPHLKPLRRPLRHSTAPHLGKKQKKQEEN